VEANGGLVEKMQGQATAQLQFSKYSPAMLQDGTVASAIVPSLIARRNHPT
jgi:hypothetical protein